MGQRVLARERRLSPCLRIASRKLADVVSTRFRQQPLADEYLDELRSAALA
jgi:hypothetical protein